MTRLHKTARHAFTMLEMMLALVLGALVIGACLSLFRVLDRSQVRQQIRMDENIQLAHAHKVIGKALQSLLMAESNLSEKDIEKRLEEDDDRNSADKADQRDEDAEATRLALQPDGAGGGMMSVQTDRGERLARAQSFLVTLRDSPVVVGEDKSEAELHQAEIERALILERALQKSGGSTDKVAKEIASVAGSAMDSERGGEHQGAGGGKSGGKSSSFGSSSKGGSKSGSLGDAKALVDKAIAGGGKSGGLSSSSSDDDLSASERLQQAHLSQPRAPGVRGVFEILPDGEAPLGADPASAQRSAAAQNSDGPLYSLWWRELPPLTNDADLAGSGIATDRDDPLSGSESAADGSKSSSSSGLSKSSKSTSKTADKSSASSRAASSGRSSGRNSVLRSSDAELADLAAQSEFVGKRELLLSGCKSIHWSALRGKKPRDKITATPAGELPAYVELEFETSTGRREKWMFEIAWVTGPEPGSILPDNADPLNALANANVNLNIDGVDLSNPNNKPGENGLPNIPGVDLSGIDLSGKPGTGRPGGPTGKPGTNPTTNPGNKPGTGNHTPIKINIDGHEIIINP